MARNQLSSTAGGGRGGIIATQHCLNCSNLVGINDCEIKRLEPVNEEFPYLHVRAHVHTVHQTLWCFFKKS